MRLIVPNIWKTRVTNRPLLAFATSLRWSCTSSVDLPTIYALSTKYGRSAISVVRVSGSNSQYVYSELTNTSKPPKDRKASVRKLYSPQSGMFLDEAVTLFFEGPKTYTGEDILELHLHGGTAIIQSVLKNINALHDPTKDIHIRYAENGEFSKRAFINGRFDLTEVEGIREVIDAETESQRIAALSSVDGSNKRLMKKWREEIVNNIALLTTLIDFGEDHDIDEAAEIFETVDRNIQSTKKSISDYLHNVQGSTVLLNGIKIALLGPTNAGKSSLLNRLANKQASIVSTIAGTTRDVLDIPLDINGYKVIVGDTAGLRGLENIDEVEREGIKRAKEKSLLCDLVMVVLPVDKLDELSYIKDHLKTLKGLNKKIVVILNKEDLLGENTLSGQELVEEQARNLSLDTSCFHLVSCKTGNAIPDLIDNLTVMFKTISNSVDTDPIIVSSRVQDLLKNDVLHSFEQFAYWKGQDDVVLACECLSQAVDGIGKITGETVGVEEILGVVFSTFCIGK